MSDAKKSFLAETEEAVLASWRKEKTFEQSLKNREGSKRFSFYDGPPFANGMPHFGHSLVTSIKDSLGRYKTMRGYYVERRNGWDCHGLPVEFAIEKQFGVSGKKQILELGLDAFNKACRESVFTYKGEWEDFFARVGRWTDTKHAYASIDRDYTESVWWVMQQVHQKGLLYKGYKCLPYCPRCETPLSNFELNEGYKDNTPDPSVFAKFELAHEPGTSLLAWTTTPWTLPANAALSVDTKADYAVVELTSDSDAGKQGEKLILAKVRLDVLDLRKKEYRIVETKKGVDLVGIAYKPLYNVAGLTKTERAKAWHVYADDGIVSLEDGTGILHTGTRYGETDLNLCLREGLPLIESVGPDGRMTAVVPEATGVFFKRADPKIVAHLTEQGRIFAAETFEHTYPFCYRCDSPLLYFTISTWFVQVSAIKDQLQKTAAQISWTPSHIKDGRFGKWLAGARDWAISRNRYWGAPMPVWANVNDENDYIVVGSIAELKELAGDNINVEDLHRPFIDKITFKKDGKTYKRIEEVVDCWFESGSMPVAQQHYPFENKEKFEQSFPADYIGEGLDQTRLWFYVQHVLATILFDRPAYKNVLVNGMIMAADGQKLSKRLKNYPPVDDVFATEGADTLRLYLLSNQQAVNADYMRFNRDAMKDINRNVLGTLNNSLRFFKMYAEIDGYKPSGLHQPRSNNVLDRWIISRLNETVTEVTKQADAYKLAHAINPIFTLIDDTSNWFIRRSRRRFWKSEDDADKKQAYDTLWYVLVRMSQLLAPWAPFYSDYLWRQLTANLNDAPQSVHLSDWPKAGEVAQQTIAAMAKARAIINEGLSARAAAKLKVRQPLASVTVPQLPQEFAEIVADELNVKQVLQGEDEDIVLDTELTDELKAEGAMRDLVRHIQNLRKTSGLNVDDRIVLHVKSNDTLVQRAVKDFGEIMRQETLAEEFAQTEQEYKVAVKIEGEEVTLSLSRA